MKPHKWQKEIIAWANGETIQAKGINSYEWFDCGTPVWSRDYEFRIKPKEFKWQKEKDHWENGGKIQYKGILWEEWYDFDWGNGSNPSWEHPECEWRIKPEESKIEYSFNDQVREDIEDILDCFDFQKVLVVMNALDWTYWYTDGVPEIWDVRKLAREMLVSVVKGLIQSGEKRYYSSSGGFYAEAAIEEGNPKIYLTLKFVVSEWDNFS